MQCSNITFTFTPIHDPYMTAARCKLSSMYFAKIILGGPCLFAQSVESTYYSYSDACNGDTICAPLTATAADSHGVCHFFRCTGCVLELQPCCFMDTCNSSVSFFDTAGDTII